MLRITRFQESKGKKEQRARGRKNKGLEVEESCAHQTDAKPKVVVEAVAREVGTVGATAANRVVEPRTTTQYVSLIAFFQ